jgi:tetratricopeptide (TPR) repeat protein
MRRLALATVFLLVCPIALAQHRHGTAAPGGLSPCKKKFAPAVLNSAFQKVQWDVPGVTADAQKFFNQGMTEYYGFNYEEAMRNFRAANVANGKEMAMAAWGVALAAGPNINLGMDPECQKLAQDESKYAKDLASEPGAIIAPAQKALIDALPMRYAFNVPPVGKAASEAEVNDALENYSKALGKSWEKFNYDTNYGTLYAESLIELHPWALYKKDGRPEPWTPDILKVLSKALAVAVDPVGATHYWIHAIEGSADPGDARHSADVLPGLAPRLGHLVHMSSHINLLQGDYKKSLDDNEKAAAVDFEEYGTPCKGHYDAYSVNRYCPQLYYGHYLSHNYFFGSVSATFIGNSEKAVELACKTRDHVERFVTNEPGLQRYMTAALMTLVVNRNWDKIRDYAEPPKSCYIQNPPFEEETGCHILRSIWYWARGMRFATLGDVKLAVTQYDAMNVEIAQTAHHSPTTWGNNEATAVLGIGKAMLFARYEWADGSRQQAIKALVAARDAEDGLNYDEPPQWFTPVREALGGAYLQLKTPEGYVEAEKVFDEELKPHRHPRSGRALYGRMRALQGQGDAKKAAAVVAEHEFCEVWNNAKADYTMTDADLWPAKNVADKSGSATTCGKPAKAPSLNTCPVPPPSPASP